VLHDGEVLFQGAYAALAQHSAINVRSVLDELHLPVRREQTDKQPSAEAPTASCQVAPDSAVLTEVEERIRGYAAAGQQSPGETGLADPPTVT
jgi:hypothetical protein